MESTQKHTPIMKLHVQTGDSMTQHQQVAIPEPKRWNDIVGLIIYSVGLSTVIFASCSIRYSEAIFCLGTITIGTGLTLIMVEHDVENETIRRMWVVIAVIVGITLGRLIFI